MPRIDSADLQIFLAVATHRSFRRAAIERGVSPSALSHAVRGIEERLGLRLFNRTTRSVALTEAGERLFARVAPAFRDIADAIADLDTLRDRPAGKLRINAARVSAELVLLPIVARFLAAYPDVQVEIETDNALVDMVSAGFDAGIRFGETIAADMIAVPLGGDQRSAIVASPDFFARHPIPQHPADLRALPCIGFRFTSGALYGWEFERDGRALTIVVDGPLTLGDQLLMLRPALDGAAIAYLFESQVTAHVAAGRLVRVLEEWCPPYPGFYLYYPSRRQMPPALRAFIDFVRDSKFSRSSAG